MFLPFDEEIVMPVLSGASNFFKMSFPVSGLAWMELTMIDSPETGNGVLKSGVVADTKRRN